MACAFTELIVDCLDAERVAQFWSAALGWNRTGRYTEAIELASPDGTRPSLTFVTVPERKTLKNRLHIDVNSTDCDQMTEVARLIGLGARQVNIGQHDTPWVVLADVEGNEFCVLAEKLPS
jgi:hypothetical protein